MAPATPAGDSGRVKLPALDVVYENEQYRIKQFDYDKQYFPYYNARLKQMKAALVVNAKQTWPNLPILSLTSLAETVDNKNENEETEGNNEDVEMEHEETVIIGTLFKKMPRQPNILKELDDEKKLEGNLDELQQQAISNFVSANDKLYLQEDDESIELKGAIDIDNLCTGVCLAVKGKLNPNGSGFIVEETCFALIENEEHELATTSVDRSLPLPDLYVCLASGLGFSRNMSKNSELVQSLNMLFDLLTGNLPISTQKPIISLIVAGNGLGRKAKAEEVPIDSTGADAGGASNAQAAWNKASQVYSNDAIKLFDKFLANVGQYIHVQVMPGEYDPSLHLWPQQPLHPCLFPRAYPLDTVRSVTNPHRARYFGADFLGASGQNVDSIRSCTRLTDTIDIMRLLMEWSHVSPATPDILHGYPFLERDPLVLNSYPDLFFVGNQPDFSLGTFHSAQGKQVKLVSVPTFEDKMLVVLVNLRNLECEMFAFN